MSPASSACSILICIGHSATVRSKLERQRPSEVRVERSSSREDCEGLTGRQVERVHDQVERKQSKDPEGHCVGKAFCFRSITQSEDDLKTEERHVYDLQGSVDHPVDVMVV